MKMIELHVGALLSGASDGIAARLDAFDQRTPARARQQQRGALFVGPR
jgi:hypothetical protein